MRLPLAILTLAFASTAFAQTSAPTPAAAPAKPKPTIYNPAADAAQDIRNAVAQAKRENKHVLLQVGGNWCGWCIKLEDMVNNDPELKRQMDDNFVLVHVNYSKEQENLPLLASLGYPQRFGFPVLVVLDANNNRLHTQDSSYLEEGSGHSKKKVAGFFKQWSPSALDPKKYVR